MQAFLSISRTVMLVSPMGESEVTHAYCLRNLTNETALRAATYEEHAVDRGPNLIPGDDAINLTELAPLKTWQTSPCRGLS
jgi:hypothetical protein